MESKSEDTVDDCAGVNSFIEETDNIEGGNYGYMISLVYFLIFFFFCHQQRLCILKQWIASIGMHSLATRT